MEVCRRRIWIRTIVLCNFHEVIRSLCVYKFFFSQLQKSASRNSESSQTVYTNHETSSRGGGVWEVHCSPDHSASMAQILQVKVRKVPNKMWRNLIKKKQTKTPWKTSVFWYSLTYRAPSCNWTYTPTPFTSISFLPPHSQYCIDIWLICCLPLNFW